MQLWRMRLRRVLLCVPAVAFLLSTQFGLHFHINEGDGHYAAPHHSHSSHFASELSGAHLAEHLLGDDIDVDNGGMLSAKLSIPAVFLTAVFACFLLFSIPQQRMKVLRPAETPLRPPRRIYLLPPSQAPPFSA
ncbi:MAG: hypothetical protein ABIQ86_17025 [Steroidobacteraceae bacterium]